MNQQELAKISIRYRARNDLSIAEMAKKCNVSLQTLWNIENEKHVATKTTEQKILMVIEDEVL